MTLAARVDGRVLRGRRTRESVVEAFLSLIEEGDPQPRARTIAARAGVSLRSVFQHFSDLEELYLAAGKREMAKVKPMLAAIDSRLPRDERVARFVSQRVQALEAMAPVAKAARLREPFSVQLRANRDGLKRQFRNGIEETFAPELRTMMRDRRDDLVEAILAAGSFSAWYALREEQRLEVDRAEAVLGLVVGRLVGGASNP